MKLEFELESKQMRKLGEEEELEKWIMGNIQRIKQ